MKKLIVICVLLGHSLAATACYRASSQDQQPVAPSPPKSSEQASRVWRPATYRGLIMGKSTRVDMLRVLGKPNWTELFEEEKVKPVVWYHYEGQGELPGDLVVHVDKRSGIIHWMALYTKNLSKDEAITHFGNDYIITRYDFDDCLGDADAAPVYESPSGSIINIEYRNRGIAVAVDEAGRVDDIGYVSEPIGEVSSKCKENHTSP